MNIGRDIYRIVPASIPPVCYDYEAICQQPYKLTIHQSDICQTQVLTDGLNTSL